MEKLTPQNEHQEHMVQVLLAKMQGVPVECKRGTDWCAASPNSVSLNTEYRIVPQPTCLPISRKMWRMINKEWKWAAMDKDGKVYFYDDEPFIHKKGKFWNGAVHQGSILTINTDGIDWEQSLTERPEGV